MLIFRFILMFWDSTRICLHALMLKKKPYIITFEYTCINLTSEMHRLCACLEMPHFSIQANGDTVSY